METKAFVDRFEEDLAVIYLDVDPSIKQKIILPREILPEDINDGDHITIKIEKSLLKPNRNKQENICSSRIELRNYFVEKFF